ncbi:MAG: sensor domain-containing diguanylate cyclase, partial [Acidimicrobiia bacterium]|nr:sensor domain-containing diguanylate cyclase [Acidimicrobiia bacterium]
AIDTSTIEPPLIPSAVVLDLLETTLPEERAVTSVAAAADIANAIASAASVGDMATLFCDVARRTVDAAEVSMIPLTAASLAAKPAGMATVEPFPFSGDRLHTLADFSYISELRAGVPLHRGGDADGLAALGVGSEVNVPIVVDDETWGVLSAARRIDQPAFDDHDVSILRHIATETASALTNTERWAEIEKMALRDQLTGLANRHVLYAVLDEIFRRDPVDRQDCAVIMCDVDGLKIVNDGLGHEAGDRLLIDAAASLRSAIRDPERSTICRIGGDEFCVVIDGGALLTAHEVSDTIERLFARSGGPNETRSISCGIAFASADVPTRSDLLRAADENQYQTKRARRAARGEPIADAVRHDGDRRAIRD